MGVRDDGNEVLRAYAVFDSTIMPPPQAKVCVFCLPVLVLANGVATSTCKEGKERRRTLARKELGRLKKKAWGEDDRAWPWCSTGREG